MQIQRIQINSYNNTSFNGEFINNKAIKNFINDSNPEDLRVFNGILEQIKNVKDNIKFEVYMYNAECDRTDGKGEDIIRSFDLVKRDCNDKKNRETLTWFWENKVPAISRLSMINNGLINFYKEKINLNHIENISDKETITEKIYKLLVYESR